MDRLVVGLPYRGMVQQCLKKVKYKSAWDVIGFLYGLCNFDDIGEGVITSVPMWKPKERMRGFNQAKTLAELIGKHMDLIERVRETKPMFGLKKKARRENVEGAFRIITNHQTPIIKQIQNSNNQSVKRIILVDDVWTTGATMRECARVLKRAGASEVWGITLAR